MEVTVKKKRKKKKRKNKEEKTERHRERGGSCRDARGRESQTDVSTREYLRDARKRQLAKKNRWRGGDRVSIHTARGLSILHWHGSRTL